MGYDRNDIANPKDMEKYYSKEEQDKYGVINCKIIYIWYKWTLWYSSIYYMDNYSTLINKLVNKKVTVVGNKPGVTKSLSTIKINDKIDLIDTPGVLWPKFQDMETALNLASMTIINKDIYPHYFSF